MRPCRTGWSKTQKVKRRKQAVGLSGRSPETSKACIDQKIPHAYGLHKEGHHLPTHFNKAQGRNLDSHLYPGASKIREATRTIAGRSDKNPEQMILAMLSEEARNGVLRMQA